MKELKVGQYWKFDNGNYWSIDLIMGLDDGVTTKVIAGCGEIIATTPDTRCTHTNLSESNHWTHLKAYNTPLWRILNGNT